MHAGFMNAQWTPTEKWLIVPGIRLESYSQSVEYDVINIRHTKKALSEGADGIIAVCAGAGGHAGVLSPFALLPEIREFHDGPLLCSGSIATGGSVLGAQAIGADTASTPELHRARTVSRPRATGSAAR